MSIDLFYNSLKLQFYKILEDRTRFYDYFCNYKFSQIEK